SFEGAQPRNGIRLVPRPGRGYCGADRRPPRGGFAKARRACSLEERLLAIEGVVHAPFAGPPVEIEAKRIEGWEAQRELHGGVAAVRVGGGGCAGERQHPIA